MTLYANMPAILSITLSILAYIISFYPHRYAGTPLPSQNPMPSSPPQSKATGPQMSPLPAVTVYRAHMMLMTILCILAVDFPVFPRTLAKCETFGVSLMDLGVGSFVFSQGLVSAIPILKNPAHLSAPAIPKIRTVIRKSLPITLLGLVRVLLVKGTSYPVRPFSFAKIVIYLLAGQEHESEYGTHWNFFITLSLLPILQVFLHPIVKRFPIALLGILVASGNDYLSKHTKLQ
ncbi:hypothetical protein C0993_011240 [Termitomyces sp. T159_Od127]|nr:hypothetical protein C0993_011240 [Termitomyces sp. T159_Od127]